jgi:hypothetical protein
LRPAPPPQHCPACDAEADEPDDEDDESPEDQMLLARAYQDLADEARRRGVATIAELGNLAPRQPGQPIRSAEPTEATD